MDATGLQAMIHDVDGTPADTDEAHRQAFNASRREFGLPWQRDVELYVELLAVEGGKRRLPYYCRRADPARQPDPFDEQGSRSHFKGTLPKQRTSRRGHVR